MSDSVKIWCLHQVLEIDKKIYHIIKAWWVTKPTNLELKAVLPNAIDNIQIGGILSGYYVLCKHKEPHYHLVLKEEVQGTLLKHEGAKIQACNYIGGGGLF